MQTFLKSITFSKECRAFKEGTTISLDYPMILLVGQNGTGKSTLLQVIANKMKIKTALMDDRYLGDGAEIVVGDVEPLSKKYFSFHSNDMKNAGFFGDDSMTQIYAQRTSSGLGTLLQFGKTNVFEMKQSFGLVDEPCRGASPKLQNIFRERLLLSCIAGGNQLIVSTHSERIMTLADKFEECVKIYSVEHQKYMTKEEFLEEHLSNPKKSK